MMVCLYRSNVLFFRVMRVCFIGSGLFARIQDPSSLLRYLYPPDHDATAYPLPSPSCSSDAHYFAETTRILDRSTL